MSLEAKPAPERHVQLTYTADQSYEIADHSDVISQSRPHHRTTKSIATLPTEDSEVVDPEEAEPIFETPSKPLFSIPRTPSPNSRMRENSSFSEDYEEGLTHIKQPSFTTTPSKSSTSSCTDPQTADAPSDISSVLIEISRGGAPSSQFDRYGFLITDNNLSAAQALEDPLKLRKENERLVKWQKMLSQFEKYNSTKSDKLARRTWKGLPDAVRGEVWKKFTATPTDPPPTVMELNSRTLSVADVDQIRKDVPRTFPTNEFFATWDPITGTLGHNQIGHEKLYQVLHAYALVDPEVGYCQGMNFIASVPLFYMPVEDAFRALVFLMQGMNYRQYFLRGFPRLKQSILILDHLMAKHLPRLRKHLKKEDVEINCFVTQWFLTMFTYNLPFAAIIRMWDWLFVEGHDVVFAVALAVLKQVQGKMLKLQGTDLLEYAMTFSGQLDLTADYLISIALEFKNVIPTVQKLKLKQPETYSMAPHEVDLYAAKMKYDTDVFFLRRK